MINYIMLLYYLVLHDVTHYVTKTLGRKI